MLSVLAPLCSQQVYTNAIDPLLVHTPSLTAFGKAQMPLENGVYELR